jgi:uncharacterized protein YjeT (DUF2065 family)
MLSPRSRWSARLLLAVALVMVLESACSQAPPPPSSADVRTMSERSHGTIVRFHTTSGITYVTSQYTATDSTVVVNSLLRDPKYYRPTEAQLYGKGELQPPPKDTILPVTVPINQIRSMDEWQSRSVASDVGSGLVLVGLIVVTVVAAFLYALSQADWGSN